MTSRLRGLCGQTITSVEKRHIFDEELEAVVVRTASQQRLVVRSSELEGQPFEAHSLAFEICDAADGERNDDVVPVTMRVARIELFQRDEWIAPYTSPHPTIGINPVSIETGPVGARPADSPGTTVVCGCALYSDDVERKVVFVYLSEYPGMIGMTTDGDQPDHAYRIDATSESLC